MFNKKGQATTEVVLIIPILIMILFFTAKVFALLIVTQKLEIASYYAGRRWQLESHTAEAYQSWDTSLKRDIEKKVRQYLGIGKPIANFLQLYSCKVTVKRVQTWNLVTLTVKLRPASIPLLCKYPAGVVCQDYTQLCYRGHKYLCISGATLEMKKYVPTRDRPVNFFLYQMF